jgi:hypothetical protein
MTSQYGKLLNYPTNLHVISEFGSLHDSQENVGTEMAAIVAVNAVFV